MNFLSYPGLQRFWTKVKSYVDTKIANSSGDKVTYSENERIVGTWIDGRPLYGITKKVNLSWPYSDTAWGSAATIELDSNIDFFIQVTGVLLNIYGYPADTAQIPNGNIVMYLGRESNGGTTYKVIIKGRDDRISRPEAYLFLRYVKKN